MLDGYLIAYLNIDEVIKIVRFEDDPKAKLISRFKLTEVQTDAILNLRLKSLSRLEEQEIKAEHAQAHARSGATSRRCSRTISCSGSASPKRSRRPARPTRRRPPSASAARTSFADAPAVEINIDEVLTEKEPITVILSEKGWIRAMKGHRTISSKLEFKQGDELQTRDQSARRPTS